MAAAANSLTIEKESYSLTVNHTFSWKIKKFSTHHKKICSPPFSPSPAIYEKFCISNQRKRFPQLENTFPQSKCYFNLERCSEESCSNTLRVQFDIKILDSNGDIMVSSTDKSSHLLHEEQSILLLKESTWRNHLDCRDAFFPVTDDVVIVDCRFEFFEHNMKTKSNSESVLMANPSPTLSILSSDFKALFESKMFCDVIIRVDFKILKAHQVVLAARSPVLKNMIGSSKSKTKCLVINDVNHDVFKGFLKYLYCGEIEDKTFTAAWNLYPLADKYNVPSLRKFCSDILVSNLTVNNTKAVLEFSFRHRDLFLEDRVLRFISANLSEFDSKPEWKNLFGKNKVIYCRVLCFALAEYEIFSEIPTVFYSMLSK